MDYSKLRSEFIKLLTEDSKTRDARRKDFNQAIFFPEDDKTFAGRQIWVKIDLGMVMEKFDRAVKIREEADRGASEV